MKNPRRLLTRSQALTQAAALDGTPSRVARAADDTGTEIADPGGRVGELWLYGVVGGWWWGFDADDVARELRALGLGAGDTLYVRIHSPGGYAPDGIAIGNLLRNLTCRVVCIVDGLAASAASVIAIAGAEVVMCPGSQLMLHDAWTWGAGNAAELRRTADWIDGQSQNYAGVYAVEAGGTADTWRQVMLANDGEGTWYTAEDSVTAGLATSVGTRPAQGEPPVPPDDVDEDLDDDLLARIAHDVQLLEQCATARVRAAWRGERPAPHQPPSASAVGSTHPKERSSDVAFTTEQLTTMRQELGLAEDADEATIVAALSEALAEQAETEPPTSTSTTAATRPEVPDGMTLIETDVLTNLQSGAADGVAARRQQADERRDRAITAAIADGRTTPSRREHWVAQFAADPDGADQMLASLPKGMVPVELIGHEGDGQQDPQAASLNDIRETPGYKNWSI